MKQEDKELLLKDLYARIPYGVKCHIEGEKGSALPIGGYISTDDNIHAFNFIINENIRLDFKILEEIKPYLYPLSSMTEEQKKECPVELSIINAFINGHIYLFEDEKLTVDEIINMFDWLNKNHFDYHDLINKNLAIDCTNLNIY